MLEASMMKSLALVVLMVAGFPSLVFAERYGGMRLLIDRTMPCDGTIQVLNDRSKQLVLWLQMVRVAEDTYKSTRGRYADLSHLRKASLLDKLVFESDSARSPQREWAANYVPATTIFAVIVTKDGEHFRASIHEQAASVAAGDEGGWSFNGSIAENCPGSQLPVLDGPQGPAFESKQYDSPPQSIVGPTSVALMEELFLCSFAVYLVR